MWRNGRKMSKEEKRWKVGKRVLARGAGEQKEMGFSDCAVHTATSVKSWGKK